MKWKSHAAVTKAVCRSLGVSDYHERIIVDGSIEPDLHPVRVRYGSARANRVAHHGASNRTINILIWKARLAFVEGDDEHGCRNLGRALHYVQDRCVRYGRSLAEHDRLEERIGQLNVSMDAIEEGLAHSQSSPFFIAECVRSLEPMRDAEAALEQAATVSAALAGSVIGSTELPSGMDFELMRLRRRRYLVISGIAVGGILIVAASVSVGQNLLLLSLPPLLGPLLLFERRYRASRKVAEWYGIE